jgi:hypothetical protein
MEKELLFDLLPEESRTDDKYQSDDFKNKHQPKRKKEKATNITQNNFWK